MGTYSLESFEYLIRSYTNGLRECCYTFVIKQLKKKAEEVNIAIFKTSI